MSGARGGRRFKHVPNDQKHRDNRNRLIAERRRSKLISSNRNAKRNFVPGGTKLQSDYFEWDDLDAVDTVSDQYDAGKVALDEDLIAECSVARLARLLHATASGGSVEELAEFWATLATTACDTHSAHIHLYAHLFGWDDRYDSRCDSAVAFFELLQVTFDPPNCGLREAQQNATAALYVIHRAFVYDSHVTLHLETLPIEQWIGHSTLLPSSLQPDEVWLRVAKQWFIVMAVLQIRVGADNIAGILAQLQRGLGQRSLDLWADVMWVILFGAKVSECPCNDFIDQLAGTVVRARLSTFLPLATEGKSATSAFPGQSFVAAHHATFLRTTLRLFAMTSSARLSQEEVALVCHIVARELHEAPRAVAEAAVHTLTLQAQREPSVCIELVQGGLLCNIGQAFHTQYAPSNVPAVAYVDLCAMCLASAGPVFRDTQAVGDFLAESAVVDIVNELCSSFSALTRSTAWCESVCKLLLGVLSLRAVPADCVATPSAMCFLILNCPLGAQSLLESVVELYSAPDCERTLTAAWQEREVRVAKYAHSTAFSG